MRPMRRMQRIARIQTPSLDIAAPGMMNIKQWIGVLMRLAWLCYPELDTVVQRFEALMNRALLPYAVCR